MNRSLARRTGGISLLCALVAVAGSAAQAPPDLLNQVRQALAQASGGPVTIRASRHTGLASFVRAPHGVPVAGATPEDRALDFLGTYAKAFGLTAATDLQHVRSQVGDRVGMDHVRYRQLHQGVPVTGAELIVHLRGSDVIAVNGRTLGTLAGISTSPSVPASTATAAASGVLAKHLSVSDAVLSEPRLEVFDRGLIGGPPVPTRLAWFVEATREDLRQFIWVDAETGGVLVRFSQLAHALSRRIYDANNGSKLPGVLVRSEGQGATGDPDADLAYDYSGDTYDYFFNQHGRDSYDDKGSLLKSTVHFCPGPADCPFANAFWNGTQMVYGEGYSAADDVDAHELTHAVTDTSAGLFYYMQSGALNESFSDIFGETVDLINGAGDDTPGVRWLMGEDVPGLGAIRNMMNPNQFGDPARVGDAGFFKCLDSGEDSGGVHQNSGVPNHAYALMVDGGTYNGITVGPIGHVKAGLIQYRSLISYLGSASDFLENHDALNQSCQDLIGTGGITPADCVEVQDALNAVEMSDPWPCAPAQPLEPAACPTGQGPVNAFFDDLENIKSGNWAAAFNVGGNHWSLLTPRFGTPAVYFNQFATSGQYHFWAYDVGATGDSHLKMNKSVVVPANARMRFDHSWGFENDGITYYDGGVLEYSTNNGVTWVDAGPLISAGADYNGFIVTGQGNPLAGREAFVHESWGYTTTQLDLSSLAGQSVRFRFRIGTDPLVDDYGWFIDDVRIYTCDVGGTVEFAAPVYAGTEAGKTASISVTRTGGQAEGVTVDYFSSDGTAQAPGDYTAVAGTLSFGSGVTSQSFSVPIVNDTIDDDAEDVLLSLTNVSGPSAVLGARDQATLVIGNDDVAGSMQFKLASYSVSEASAQATITVTRSGGIASGVTVQYHSSDGTATSPGDYAAVSGTLTFGAKVTSQTFTVPIVPDTLDELNETLTLTLSNPGGGGVLGGNTQVTLTITDNDAGGALQIGAATYNVSEAGPVATITLTRVGGLASGVTVNYATADGTAKAGADYTTSAGVLAFGANDKSKTFEVPIADDGLGENNETVLLSISNPTGGATLGARTTSTLTILENETVLQFSIAQSSVAETAPKATITVKRSGNTTSAVSVPYITADATAQSGLDYLAASGTLVFPAKATSKTFTVSILPDTFVEGSELVSLSLLPPTGGVLGPLSAATLTITDDEPQLYLSAASYTVNEGVANATITVKRAGSKTSAVSVEVDTSDGTASEGLDYTGVHDVILSLAPGAISKTFTVPILTDTEAEPAETVHLTLSNPTGATLGLSSALLTITDNEPTLGFSMASYSVSETAASIKITVKRTGASSGISEVDYATSDGTAQAGPDYQSASGRLIFAPKVTTQTFTVTIAPDANAEPTETVNLALSNVSAGTGLGLANATLRITNDDPSISFSVAAPTVKEAVKSLTVTVKRTGVITGPASVDYATSDGTASAGADYTAVSGTLSFPPKVATRSFVVPLLPDTLDESNETIELTLSNPSGGVLGEDEATITITDDDTAGTIELAAPSFSGTEAGGVAVITVKRSGGTASGASVQYATSDGTADAGADYTATSGTLTFLAGQTSKTFEVPILGDGAPEPTETFNVTLSNPGGGATLGAQANAVAYIVSAEALPVLSIGDVSVSEGNAGTANADFTVTLSPTFAQTVTVDYTTANGTATAPSDYTTVSGTLTFNPFEPTKTISVPVVGDTDPEVNETFFVNLSNPGNATLADAQGQGTITNDDVVVSVLSINDVARTEGNSGTANATFTVTLSPTAQQTVTVQYATADGTAVAGSQGSQAFSNTNAITILDNGAGAPYPSTINVQGVTGTVTKVTATLNGFGHSYPADTDVLLVGPAGQKVMLMSDVGGGQPGVSNVNIVLDDAGGPLPNNAFGSGTYRPTNNEDSEPLGDSFPAPAPGGPYGTSMAAFNGVNPNGNWQLYVMDDFNGDSGTLAGGWKVTITTNGDYTAVSGTLTFTPGAATRTLNVPIVGDTVEEGNETYFVNLSNPTGTAVIGDGQGLGTITNDDCSDGDGDRLCNAYETDTGVYVSPTDTGTDPALPDTDGDQLPDGDEVLGTLANLNLPAMGTNPLKKNILLEYDWMNDNTNCGSHSHRPRAAVVNRVTAAFAAAPVSNPDGTTGIVAIHDYGQGGAFTEGNLIPDADGNITGGVNGADFQNKKAVHFDANRNGYFHYVINPHYYTDAQGSSGQAELPGDDLIVSMDCFDTDVNFSNTIMHELGHNLNLGHGGFKHCNWKPNYNSVMNYRFQFSGVDTNCDAVGDTGEGNVLDYARGLRIALNETNLNENLGSCGGANPIDWNFSGNIQNGVFYDLNRTSPDGSGPDVDNSNCGGDFTTLTDYNDWANILLTGLGDTDGQPLLPFQIIDCNNPLLSRERPR